MPDAPATPGHIGLFDPERHDRSAFSCGVAQVDNYFKRTAGKLARAGNSRLYVMERGGDVMGFYALNAHSVDYTQLPARYARTRPAHGAIPAAYISMIGVDQRFAGEGHGGILLADALTRIAQAASRIGIAMAMLDVLDCGDPQRVERRLALYERYGFRSLPSQRLRMFLPVATVMGMMGED
jgi:ribosomal protein S18 acetylase RimI-like enzyme